MMKSFRLFITLFCFTLLSTTSFANPTNQERSKKRTPSTPITVPTQPSSPPPLTSQSLPTPPSGLALSLKFYETKEATTDTDSDGSASPGGAESPVAPTKGPQFFDGFTYDPETETLTLSPKFDWQIHKESLQPYLSNNNENPVSTLSVTYEKLLFIKDIEDFETTLEVSRALKILHVVYSADNQHEADNRSFHPFLQSINIARRIKNRSNSTELQDITLTDNVDQFLPTTNPCATPGGYLSRSASHGLRTYQQSQF